MHASRHVQRVENAQREVNRLTARLNGGDDVFLTEEQINELQWQLERAREQLENARWLEELHR